MALAAIRDQPVDIFNAKDGKKLCTVKAGPKTHVNTLKGSIHQDTGIAEREQKILRGSDEHISYHDGEQIGSDLFKNALDMDKLPSLRFMQLSAAEADKEEACTAAKERIKNGTKLKDLEDDFRNEADIVLFAVEHTNPTELQHSTLEVRSDGPSMLQALRISTTSMYYVADSLWQNRSFMKSAVSIDGLLLGAKMVPTDWRTDVEMVMFACENNGMALKFASTELKDDRSVVLAAVCQRGTALMYASEDLKSDYYVVLDAVRNNKMAIVHAKGGLREDDDIRGAAGQAASDKTLVKVEKIKAKFHELDANGDGYLSYDELHALLKKGNPDLDESEIQLLYGQMDTHHDERVDFHEFCDFLFREEE